MTYSLVSNQTDDKIVFTVGAWAMASFACTTMNMTIILTQGLPAAVAIFFLCCAHRMYGGFVIAAMAGILSALVGYLWKFVEQNTDVSEYKLLIKVSERHSLINEDIGR